MFSALSRHGVVERSVARASGISNRQWNLAHQRGELIRVHPRVSRLADAEATEPQRILAAAWSAGGGALASHRAAALLWDAPVSWQPGVTPVDVLVPHRRRLEERAGMVIHRTKAPHDLDPSWRQGIPCTNPLRTLVDLGSVAPGDVPATFTDFAVRRLVTPGAAHALVARHSVRGRHGIGLLREVLADWPFDDAVPDSALEVEIARLLRRARIDGFEFHPVLLGYEVDFAHRAARLVIEGDGFEFHSSRLAFETDRHRDAVLAAAGWQVLRLTWRSVTVESAAVIERLRATVSRRLDDA